MSIVVTPIPRLIDLAAPAFTLGTANAAGTAATAVASDSTLLAFDTTLPAAVSTAGAVGASTVAPRRDHVHAGGIVEATQAQVEAETAGALYVPPDLVTNSPGVAKAWVKFTMAAVSTVSFNVASVTDAGLGDFIINWEPDFSSANYVVEGTPMVTAVDDRLVTFSSPSAALVYVQLLDGAGTRTETGVSHVLAAAFGDQ